MAGWSAPKVASMWSRISSTLGADSGPWRSSAALPSTEMAGARAIEAGRGIALAAGRIFTGTGASAWVDPPVVGAGDSAAVVSSNTPTNAPVTDNAATNIHGFTSHLLQNNDENASRNMAIHGIPDRDAVCFYQFTVWTLPPGNTSQSIIAVPPPGTDVNTWMMLGAPN